MPCNTISRIHVLNSFDWSSLGNGTVVDIEGSHGEISIELAQKFPDLRFVVQDRGEVMKATSTPKDLGDRVEFSVHDFFEDQSVKHADVYFFQWTLHNWGDRYATKILIPALRHGAWILIQELLLPEPGTMSAFQERKHRATDIGKMAMANSKERDRNDWVRLLEDADPRFVLKHIDTPTTSELSMVEVQWDDSGVSANGQISTNGETPTISRLINLSPDTVEMF